VLRTVFVHRESLGRVVDDSNLKRRESLVLVEGQSSGVALEMLRFDLELWMRLVLGLVDINIKFKSA
jgi:hypothetical protein